MSTGQIIKFGDTFANYNTANFASHTFKVGFVKSAANGGIDPAVSTPAPCWGSGGTTNLSSSQVATGGTSYTGPQTLAGVSFSSVAGVATFSANNLSLAADASGFTNARWAIVYDDSDSTKRAICAVDLGADQSIATTSLTIQWNSGASSGTIFTL